MENEQAPFISDVVCFRMLATALPEFLERHEELDPHELVVRRLPKEDGRPREVEVDVLYHDKTTEITLN